MFLFVREEPSLRRLGELSGGRQPPSSTSAETGCIFTPCDMSSKLRRATTLGWCSFASGAVERVQVEQARPNNMVGPQAEGCQICKPRDLPPKTRDVIPIGRSTVLCGHSPAPALVPSTRMKVCSQVFSLW